MIINRIEFQQTIFTPEERDLIVNYAYKLGNMEKTKELAEKLAYMETYNPNNAALTIIDAQAEIDALPDSMIGLSEMGEYGYTWIEMLPLTQKEALKLFDHDVPVYLLHEDDSETTVEERKQIEEHRGIFGIEKGDWEKAKDQIAMMEEVKAGETDREAQLFQGTSDKYGIYQLKDNPELRNFRFMGTESLKHLGITKDNFEEIQPENYSLIYTGELAELQRHTQGATLEAIYQKFNKDHPEDFRGHSLSVSDIVVLHQDGAYSSHFVDSFGFTGLPLFTENLLEEQGIERGTSGHDVQKLQPVKEESELSDVKTENREPEKEENEQSAPDGNEAEQEQYSPNQNESKAVEREDMEEVFEDGDEIIDLGDDREQVLATMKQSLDSEQDTSGHNVQKSEMEASESIEETELAFSVADRFITIQETEGGFDYSIMGMDYKEIDGGVYDNPDITIREALGEIVEDLKTSPDYNGAKGNIQKDDVLIPMDSDGLMEKVEEANRIQPVQAQSSVVADFKAKTNELFHDISELNPSEVEDTVKCHVQAVLNEAGVDAAIVDVAVVGSRCRGLEQEGSDLNVVVEFATSEREDDLFHILNGSDALHIGGIKVDINPITAQRTGTLESYLPVVEEYLETIRMAREQEAVRQTQDTSEHDVSQSAQQNGLKSEQTEQEIDNKAILKRLSEKIPLDKLAVDIDQFSYNYDPHEYRNIIESREEGILSVQYSLASGDTEHLSEWLQGIIDEGEQKEDVAKAKELLGRLSEYKPLAKIEELEEQNYNIIDEVLNNGFEQGKKAESKQKAEAANEQEKPAIKVSLKERLAQKKAI